MENINVSANALLAALGDLTPYELRAMVDNPGKLKKFCAALVAESVRNTFVTPFCDNAVRYRFPQFADWLPPWRRYAVTMDYRGPVAWKIRRGFTLKIHSQTEGQRDKKLEHLLDWGFINDATKDELVFWVPRLAEQSTGKTVAQMEARRQTVRELN